MKRILIFTLLFIGQMSFSHLRSQTSNDDAIYQKLSLISDSINIYKELGDNEKGLAICKNGIKLLFENELFDTPASCILSLQSGEFCMKLKDYYNAKFFLYNSFVLDELGEFGIGVYSVISKRGEIDTNIKYFKELLDLIKSDTTYLKMLATEPDMLAYRINSVALDCYKKGEYSLAIDFFEMEINLLDALGKTGNDDYLSIVPVEVCCATRLSNYDLAKSLADHYLWLVEIFKGKISIEYAEALQTKASVEEELGNSTDALNLYNESLSLIENIKGKNNIDYIKCLRKLGSAYRSREGNHIKQLEIELQAENLLDSAIDATIDDKVQNLHALSGLYGIISDNANHMIYAEKAVNLLEANGQTGTSNYASMLNLFSNALIANHSYSKAIEIGEKSVAVFSQINRTADEEIMYRQSISSLSCVYFEAGNIDKAITVLLPLLSDEMPDDKQKLSDIHRMVTYYQRAGRNDMMKKYCEASLQLAERIGGKKSDVYADALLFASSIQGKKGDTRLMLQEAADIYLEKYGENNRDYIDIQKVLAHIGAEYEKPSTRKTQQTSILNKYENLYGKNSRNFFHEYINYVYIKGNQFIELKDIENLYATTLELDSLSQEIRILFHEKDELYLWAGRNLAEMVIDCYKLTLDTTFYNKGVEIQNKIVSIAFSLYGNEHIKYITELENLARIKSSICYLYNIAHSEESNNIIDLYGVHKNNTKKVWEYYETTLMSKCYIEIQELQRRVIDYYIQSDNVESLYYANACKKLADYYSKEIYEFPFPLVSLDANDYVKIKLEIKQDIAERLYKEALDIYKKNKDFGSAANVLRDLSMLSISANDETQAANFLSESFTLWKNETLKQMSLMTSDEKSQMVFNDFWQSQIDHYSTNGYQKSIDSKYAGLSYDVQLLAKGLLLKSEISLRDLILDTGDSIIINKFNRLSEIKNLLSNPEKESDRDALNREYQQLERQIMKESEVYGNYLHDFSYTFNDVKASLGKNDVAIEFATMRTLDNNLNWSREYFALALKYDYSSPHIIHLGSNISLDSIYQKIWEPLFDEIKGMENVYFSPTYDLNNLPLESAIMPDGSLISDIGINFYRVSSTREIIKQHNKDTYKSVVLYGGLNYDTDIETLIASDTEERSKGLRGIRNMSDDIEDDLLRGNMAWRFLQGTRIEVEEIEKIALNFGIKTKLFSASNGTESTLKNLSGKKVDILHIATHGFYIKSFDNKNEENQMERSGLALAGANNKQKGIALPKGVDDGILTADEISRLDLRGADLIVLSACETGLGDITSEGVYGLQRAFKKAGVQTIVMSLWKVDDEATKMLMVEFYKNLLNGKTKRESLMKAQQAVRNFRGFIGEEMRDFSNPKYWAGFIMLDGIDTE